MSKTYIEKIVEVKAVQWKGLNSDEVAELAGNTDMGNPKSWVKDDLSLIVNSIDGHVAVPVSSYIVKCNKNAHTGGKKYKNYYLHIYSESEFESKYEEA